MAVSSRRAPNATLTGRSPARRPREGAVTGHLFKVIREHVPRTQDELAEALGVDKTTVQGWESGRRPLTSTQAGNLRAISRTLLRLGAPSLMLTLLDEAVDADAVITHALSGPPSSTLSHHPLSSWVFTRDTTHMLAWALKGVPPAALPAPAPKSRRGPSRSSPLLDPSDRQAFLTTCGEPPNSQTTQGRGVPCYAARPSTCARTTQLRTHERGLPTCAATPQAFAPAGLPTGQTLARSPHH